VGIEQIETLLTFLALLVGGKRGALEKKREEKVRERGFSCSLPHCLLSRRLVLSSLPLSSLLFSSLFSSLRFSLLYFFFLSLCLTSGAERRVFWNFLFQVLAALMIVGRRALSTSYRERKSVRWIDREKEEESTRKKSDGEEEARRTRKAKGSMW
jgi:hypothetical protein